MVHLSEDERQLLIRVINGWIALATRTDDVMVARLTALRLKIDGIDKRVGVEELRG